MLTRDGHDAIILTRGKARDRGPDGVRFVTWTPNGSVGPWSAEIGGTDAIVNLAGESIAGRRWTAEQKQRIRDSRINATRSLVESIKETGKPPQVLVSGSAVGYYGPHGDEVVTEETPAGHDFLASVASDWEAEAMRATSRIRVVCIRTGIVLARRGGALPKMLLPFQLGAGGQIGSGRQYWPWIHWGDWIDLVRFAIQNSTVTGPLNATAPQPVTNREFAQALGRVLHRPTLVPTPGFVLKLLMGEMATALLLSGQRVEPAKAERLGFTFSFKHVEEALGAVLRQ
jgi:hypothetical protein